MTNTTRINSTVIIKVLCISSNYLELLLDRNFTKGSQRPLQAFSDLRIKIDLLLQKRLHANSNVLDLLPIELIDLSERDVTNDLSPWRHVHQILAKKLVRLGLELLVCLNGILFKLHDLGHLLNNAPVKDKPM